MVALVFPGLLEPGQAGCVPGRLARYQAPVGLGLEPEPVLLALVVSPEVATGSGDAELAAAPEFGPVPGRVVQRLEPGVVPVPTAGLLPEPVLEAGRRLVCAPGKPPDPGQTAAVAVVLRGSQAGALPATEQRGSAAAAAAAPVCSAGPGLAEGAAAGPAGPEPAVVPVAEPAAGLAADVGTAADAVGCRTAAACAPGEGSGPAAAEEPAASTVAPAALSPAHRV